MIRLGFLFWLLCGSQVLACNIPVFRYALERWEPDVGQIVIWSTGEFSAEQQQALEHLQTTVQGQLNARVKIHQGLDRPEDWMTTDVPGPGEALLACSLSTPQGQRQFWSSPLSTAQVQRLVDSPVRRELVRQLQNGTAALWLLVSGTSVGATESMAQLVQAELRRLSQEIPFPEGIGLPGSELYSSIPLTMDFTVLRVDRDDPAELALIELIRGVAPEIFESGSPLLIPVFGRGRALEVLSTDQLTPDDLQDLSLFLTGACSCQVKEQNPGFDLLLQTDWEGALFLEGEGPPPEARLLGSRRNQTVTPEMVPIAQGNPSHSATNVASPSQGHSQGQTGAWLLFILVLGAVILSLGAGKSRIHHS